MATDVKKARVWRSSASTMPAPPKPDPRQWATNRAATDPWPSRPPYPPRRLALKPPTKRN
jgi:hypothetical protein